MLVLFLNKTANAVGQINIKRKCMLFMK